LASSLLGQRVETPHVRQALGVGNRISRHLTKARFQAVIPFLRRIAEARLP
jgi:hypothetical protein